MHGSIQPAVLAALGAGYRTCAELVEAIPEANPNGIYAAIRRMVEIGTVVRVGHGRYDIAPPGVGACPLPVVRRAQVRDHVMQLPAGTVIGYREICGQVGAARSVAAGAFSALERGGYLVRIASGRFARTGPGAIVDPEDAELPRYAQVARLLAGASALWSTQSVQAALVDPASWREARTILDSMFKEGWVERPQPSMWRLTRAGRSLFRPGGRLADPKGRVLSAMVPGRAVGVPEIAEATGLGSQEVGLALDRLEAEGRAVHVVYGHWRPAWIPAALDPDRGPWRVRALARLIDRRGPCSAQDLGDALGMDPKGYYKGVEDLVDDGVATRVRHGYAEIDATWRKVIRARLEAKGIMPRLTPLEAILGRAARASGPWDEAALAGRTGLGREHVSEGIGRLRAMGRILDVDGGRCMLI